MTGVDGRGLDLAVEGLVVEARDGRRLLEVPELLVPAGGSLAIRGPSGAGKSTLLHALAGLVPARGRVAWGGTDIVALNTARRAAFRREHVGYVFQDFLLFEALGAEANASLAAGFALSRDRAAIRQRARAALARLGIRDQGRRPVSEFSGGERQRIAVARALAHDPSVILADEPTASLDRASADRLIEDLLAEVREQGRTLVVVSHDAALAERLDRCLHLVDGAVAELSHA